VSLGQEIVSGPAAGGTALRSIVDAPAFQALDAGTQRELVGAVDKVAAYLEADPEQTLSGPLAGGLAGPLDLRQRMAQSQPGGRVGAPAPGPAPAAQPPAAPGPSAGTGAVGRVGEATRATLNAIDFPQFVAALIQGTFKAIVDASIQQMEAYAALLKNVAATIDRFMDDNVTEGMAKDHLANEHSWLFKRDTTRGQPQLTVDRNADRELPGFLKDLGFSAPAEIDRTAVDTVVVPATRRTLAETRQQTLATMVLMGINRIVVDDGEIKAKLMFHIDASETTQLRFDQQKATTGNMAGEAGSGMFNAQALMVNTASINAQSDLNIRADLTGEVRVKFRSDVIPLERFADSAAIQLINANAKVPERPAAAGAPAAATPAAGPAPRAPLPPPPPLPTAGAPAAPPPAGPAAPAPAPTPPPSAPPASGQQGLVNEDPWMP
jgi:hypothetical protein